MGNYDELKKVKDQLKKAIDESKTIGGLVFNISNIKEIYDCLLNNYFVNEKKEGD